MKPYNYRFDKVLTFREQEKTETEVEFKGSVEAFETVATKLYDLLKKKEDTLTEQQVKMAVGFSVNEIHYYARFISSLEKRIAVVQQQVVQARSKMNWYENKLLEKTLEVRKFEKMKEKDREHHRAEMEQLEAIQLDELSTLKFRRRENR
ncbi:flagellar export protein FliJ [Sporosarcina sp. FSL K6-1540]|uniref:Flagellar FliJ protein n=1 Tax=Sporosarcina psychrophila TaxID=1476 RepID=A0ABV2K7V3_SPOPS|nr:flagellar export protein FliJ [Sporosarcina psychrophila]AMQ07230.1 flagellar biosynthesis chaperone [Sporosarcina psychrophila]